MCWRCRRRSRRRAAELISAGQTARQTARHQTDTRQTDLRKTTTTTILPRTMLSRATAGLLALATGVHSMPMPSGNITGGNASAAECRGDCLMMKMMEEKRLHFAECRAESKLTHGVSGCPTIRPSTQSALPCENGQSGEYACSGVDLLSYVGMEDLGSSETNDICTLTPSYKGLLAHPGLTCVRNLHVLPRLGKRRGLD